MATILTTIGFNIKSPFIAAVVPTWVLGSRCALGHITWLLSFKLCLCASFGNAHKSNFQKEVSANDMCAGICLIYSCITWLCCVHMHLPTALVPTRLYVRFPDAHCIPQSLVNKLLPDRVGFLSAPVVRSSHYNLPSPVGWPHTGASFSQTASCCDT